MAGKDKARTVTFAGSSAATQSGSTTAKREATKRKPLPAKVAKGVAKPATKGVKSSVKGASKAKPAAGKSVAPGIVLRRPPTAAKQKKQGEGTGKGKGKKAAPAAETAAADDLSDSDIADEPTSASSKKAVEFRFLPPEFQEPELLRYCGQFGSSVAGCVCLRHKRTNSSRGIAIVSLKDEAAIPLLIEESNGMLLGNRTVRCKTVYLKRSLPPLRRSLSRRAKDIHRRTRGPQLRRFVNGKVLGTRPAAGEGVVPPTTEATVGALIKYSRKEKAHNRLLERMGIPYQFNGFQSQMRAVPRGLVKSKEEMKVLREAQKVVRQAKAVERKAAKRAAPRPAKRTVAAA